MKSDTYKFAVIGNGYMAKRHMACIEQHPRAELALLVSRGSVLKSTLRDVPAGHSFADDGELLSVLRSRRDIDAVMVCSPDETHARYVSRLLPGPQLVFCEKPLGRTAAEFSDLLALPRPERARIAVGMNCRFRRKFGYLKQQLDHGACGRITFVTARYHSNIAPVLEGKLKGWWFDYPPTITPFLHGGAIHLFDILRFLFGEIDEAFCVRVASRAGEKLGGDSFIVLFRFTTESMANITITGTSFAPNSFQIAFDGDRGSMTDSTTHLLDATTNALQAGVLPEDDMQDLGRQLDHLITVLDGGATPLNTLDEAYMNYQVIKACETSLASSAWAKVSHG